VKGNDIRSKYLAFFAGKGHQVMQSASLVPHDDPSLLWVNSGVATFKTYFDGRETPENPRITSSQKCIRTNDIENVGKTARHQTLFEMLGNFSIGDYFKREAIHYAWEFLTEWMGMDKDRLWVTVFPDDADAAAIWINEIELPEERIVYTEENFWDIGEGPCGPCSEIFYDCGPGRGCNSPDCKAGICDCDRYLEVWNLVFSEFNHNADGTYTPLPKKNIDTGMGLERMALVMQNVATNFDTDLFRPIIDAICRLAGVSYGQTAGNDVALKVIADHIRTVVFAVADGALPSNEGRGYVIRRLLRRAVRYGKVLGINRPFLSELVDLVCSMMADAYPETAEKANFVKRVVRAEEERFHETLLDGEQLLAKIVRTVQEQGKTELPGLDVFRLYDTFGFPIDLTEEIAGEHGMTVDRMGFDEELAKQRDRARAARQGTESMQSERGVFGEITEPSVFVGYVQLTEDATITAIVKNNELVQEANAGQVYQLLLDETPFYAQSGGQVADQGKIVARIGDAVAIVEDVQKAPKGQHVHTVRVETGTFAVGMAVKATVSNTYREDVVKNHTATHLLQKALREVLGEHVAQAGSLVAPDRLRFDFSHFGALTKEEISEVELRVNRAVWENEAVRIEEMDLDDAKLLGAMALFGEKYGARVRVVRAGTYSIELCGGCHVRTTGEIGMFRILSETGIGAGIRRVEAVTGRNSYSFVREREQLLEDAAAKLKANVSDVPTRIDALQETLRDLERHVDSLKGKLGQVEARQLADQQEQIAGVPTVASVVRQADLDSLRQIADDIQAKIGGGIVVLGSVYEGKVSFVASVGSDWVKRGYHAGELIKRVAALAGGSGGGRADMAQAGGKQPEKVQEAIAYAREWIELQATALQIGSE